MTQTVAVAVHKQTPTPPSNTGKTTPPKVAAKTATPQGSSSQGRTVADRFKTPVAASKSSAGRTVLDVQTTACTRSPQGNSSKWTGSRTEQNLSSILKSGLAVASKRKRSRSSSKSREAPKRNKEMDVDEILGKLLSSLKTQLLEQTKNSPRDWNLSKPRVKFTKQRQEEAAKVAKHDEANIIIMGDSQLATEIAARLDANLIPSIARDNHHELLECALGESHGSVKVALIDFDQHNPDCSRTPAEIRERLLQAGELVSGYCSAQKHSEKHCELIHFQPMSTPSEYVCDDGPGDMDPSNNCTDWYNSMTRCCLTSVSARESFAFTINLHTQTHSQRNKHHWPNWTQFDPVNLDSKADCSTLTDTVLQRALRVSCKHITMFDSSRRRPVLE